MRAGRAVRIVPSAKLWAWPPRIAIAIAVCHECPYKLSAMLNVACVCPPSFGLFGSPLPYPLTGLCGLALTLAAVLPAAQEFMALPLAHKYM